MTKKRRVYQPRVVGGQVMTAHRRWFDLGSRISEFL
jgi:hypothetical protein